MRMSLFYISNVFLLFTFCYVKLFFFNHRVIFIKVCFQMHTVLFLNGIQFRIQDGQENNVMADDFKIN